MFRCSIRLKVLLALTVFIILFLGIIVSILQRIILGSFLALENKEAIRSIERTKVVFDRQILNLDAKLADWAVWDDTYIYVQDNNQDFVESNLSNQALNNLGINGMFFIASSGALLYEKQVGTNPAQSTAVINNLANVLLQSKKIISFSDINDKRSGVIRDPSGLIMFASRPIIKSDSTGPIAGTLVFTRYFDEELKDYFKKINNSNEIEIIENNEAVSERYVEAKKQIDAGTQYYAYPLSSDIIAGFAPVYDFNGQIAYILKTELPREIYKEGAASIMSFFNFSVFISVAGIIFVLMLINRLVLAKISKLNKDVNTIKNPGSSTTKLEVKGNDEFASLASNINNMLDEINKSQEDLKKSDEELKQEKASLDLKVLELERMNKLMVGRELKLVELKRELNELKGKEEV